MTVDTPVPASSKPGVSGQVTPHHPTWLQRAAARLIHGLIWSVSHTLRYRWAHDSWEPPPDDRPYIFCIWHNRVPLSVAVYHEYTALVGSPRKMAGMVSASRDGALLSRVLELLGVQPVRGSSSRRGAQALLELNSWLERGYDVALTVDGPRGPRYTVKPGVVGLAQVTGRAIVPAMYWVSRKWTLKSWDRFQIPLPFATCTIRFGEPIHISREASEEEREAIRQELERRLVAMTVD